MEYPKVIEHGLMFHHLHNERHLKGQGIISQDDFEAILNFVGTHRILSPVEWLEKLDHGKLNKEHLCITFDDGLLCQYEIALPILDKYNLKAFWFVYSSVFEGHLEKLEIYRFFRSNFFPNIDAFYDVFFRRVFSSEFSKLANEVLKEEEIKKLIECFPFYGFNDVKFRLVRDRALGRQEYEGIMDTMITEYGVDISDLVRDLWMTSEDLRYLSENGHVVGLHSYSHPTALANLSYEEQFREYDKNYLHLKRVSFTNALAMSHPCNSYNEDTIEILKHFGIKCGFRANMFPKEEGVQINSNNLELAREDQANVMRMLRS